MVAPSSSTVVITQLLQFYVITEAELEANFDISVLQFTRYQYKKKKTIINTLKCTVYKSIFLFFFFFVKKSIFILNRMHI